MANKKSKPRAMRSRSSGVKTLSLVKSNLSILKKLAVLFVIVLFAACTPTRYINVHSYRTFKHRPNYYTVPVWVQGHGVMLQQIRTPKPPRRGKH